MNNNTSDQASLIEQTVSFVKTTLKNAESGHDWYHIERVWKLSNKICAMEKSTRNVIVDELVIQLASLLHDIADHKFHNGDETVGPKVAKEFLTSIGVDTTTISKVCDIISQISFKGASETNMIKSLEGEIVQDADRLDAIGAIGIARTFSYGGHKNRLMYDPEHKPKPNMNWQQYKASTGSTINHFYEKLLLIKDRLNTESARRIAKKRHEIMEQFLDNFYNEWECNTDNSI